MLPIVLLAALTPLFVLAQDGGISGATSSTAAAGYSCDSSKCQLPNCNCASTSPPGGLPPVSVLSRSCFFSFDVTCDGQTVW